MALATIRTAIALYDGVTGPLKSMHKAMSIVLNSFEAMQRASGNAIDTASLQQAREELARADAALNNIEDSIRNDEEAQRRFNQRIRDGDTAAGGLWDKLKGIAMTVGGLAALQKLIGLSDELSSTKARLNLLVDDGGSVDALEKKIMASAQRSRSAYFDTASAVAKLGLNAGNAFGGDMDQVIAFMEQVNKQFVIGGATAQEQSNAMVQLTQAMAAGALRGEELNSILDGAPGIARAIEKYMGIAEGSIKTVAEKGEVSAQVVKNALFAMADETNEKFESMPKTWAQIWTEMQNKALSVFSPILTKLSEIGNSDRFGAATDGLMAALAALASVAATIFDGLVTGVAWVADNWEILSPLILGVAAALGVYYGAQVAANVVEAISKGLHVAQAAAKMLQLAVTGKLTAVTAAETAAQYGLNAAMYACPIVWIIMLIIALVALFYAAVAAVNHFAGTSVSATGIICGAFLVVLAVVGNVFVSLYNLVMEVFAGIYNVVAAVANFIGNVFQDPVGAVARLFFDLVDVVLSLLKTLASAIDNIFGSHLADAVQGWRDSLGGWVDRKFGKGKEIMAKVNSDEMKLGRFEYGKAWNTGYNFGKNLGSKVSGLFDSTQVNDPMGAFNTGNTLDSIYNNTNDIADNTAKAADALDMSAEELRLLRDIAERDAINKFTTAEIRVEMNNQNTITGTNDLDGIIDDLEKKIEEAMIEVSEGVHI